MKVKGYCERCRVEVPADLGEARCPHCGQTWTVAGEPTASMPGQPSSDAPKPSLEIPGFEIQEQLGKGGMGYVMKAVEKNPRRTVAIKVLSDLRFAHRFQREADAMARLNHPNILTIFSTGDLDGRPYLVMEYVDGPEPGPRSDLGCHIPQRGLDQITTKKVLLQVAAALAHVHRAGIIHRDIKPSNIMIDRHFNAKLADFGIAAFQNAQQTQLTTHGGLMGTPDYMSPEQRTDARDVTEQSDIYSMGVVAYKMLTGDLPVGKYSLPSTAKPLVHRGWDPIIDKALAQKPENRQKTIEEFAAAIERLRLDAPEFHCPKCGEEVGEQDASCPLCQTTLLIACPSCGRQMRQSETECHACGISMKDVDTFSDSLRQARELLTKARIGGALPDRLESTRRAYELVEKSLTKVVNSGEAFALRTDIQSLNDTLLLQAADAKRAEELLADAGSLYEQVLRHDPHNAAAKRWLAEIEKRRTDFVRGIQLQVDSNRPQEARELLSLATQSFPNDEELRMLQSSLAKLSGEAEELISRIPGLAEKGHWWEVRRIVKSVGESNLPEGIGYQAVRAEQHVRNANGYVEIGEQALRELRYDTAFQNAEIAIKKVADHPRARTLRDKLRGLTALIRLRERKLDRAAAAFRWFGAMRHLRMLPKLGGSPGKYAAQQARIWEGIQHANAYAVLFAWFLMGGVSLIVACCLTVLNSESDDLTLRAVFEVSGDDGMSAHAPSWLAAGAVSADDPFASPVLIGNAANGIADPVAFFASVAPLLAFFPIIVILFSVAFWILGRRLLFAAPIGWFTVTLIAATVALLILWLRKEIDAAKWLSAEPLAVQMTVDFCLQMWAIVVIGMALGFVAAQPMRRLFRDRFDWSAWRGPLTGAVAIIPITVVSAPGQFDLSGYPATLPLAAIALCGLLPVIGVASSWRRYLVLPIVALLAGWLCEELECQEWDWEDWRCYLPVAILLTAVLLPRPGSVRMLVRAAITIAAVLVVFSHPILISNPPVNVLLVLWCVLIGELFLPVLDQLDCRFHLLDRIMLTAASRGEATKRA